MSFIPFVWVTYGLGWILLSEHCVAECYNQWCHVIILTNQVTSAIFTLAITIKSRQTCQILERVYEGESAENNEDIVISKTLFECWPKVSDVGPTFAQRYPSWNGMDREFWACRGGGWGGSGEGSGVFFQSFSAAFVTCPAVLLSL